MSGLIPAKIAESPLEDSQQMALFCWLAINSTHTPELLYAFAVPNGGLRDKITAARLKATGAKRGVPDIVQPTIRLVDSKWWPGMFVELKKVKGGDTRNPDQLRWAEYLKGQGYAHFLCKGYYAAREPFMWYFGQNLPWRDEP
jgi:hypothetical protein